MIHGASEEALEQPWARALHGEVQLIFTSPPFPLNHKKSYGNLQGEEYVKWLAAFAPRLCELLTPNGSIVIEMGNAWEPGSPTMSTLALEALLAFRRAGDLHLCQEFIWSNPAKLPTPAQWVNVERIRVKDSFTRLWWLSPTERPQADNRRVLVDYSSAMKRLLRNRRYNSGKRPSEHSIGAESFFVDNGGAIPPSVLELPLAVLEHPNTRSHDAYQGYCRRFGLDPHPARMPPEVAEFFIRFLTTEHQIVFDPFGGSNTTGEAAEKLGRQWVSVEVDEEYIGGSLGRFQGQTVIGSSFALSNRFDEQIAL